MEQRFKHNLVEKFLEFLVLVYFVFGLCSAYTWGCISLDTRSNHTKTLVLWNPICTISAVFTVMNAVAVIFCIQKSQRSSGESLINDDSHAMFLILSIPLFLVTTIYLSWKFVEDCISVRSTGDLTFLMTASEMILFAMTMFLITTLNRSKPSSITIFAYRINHLTTWATMVGIINYVIFHLSDSQITIMVKEISRSNVFHDFAVLQNQTTPQDAFTKFQHYTQPMVILFCCCCIAYILPLLLENIEQLRLHESLNDEVFLLDKGDSYNSIEFRNLGLKSYSISRALNIKVPPVSFLLGVAFITVTVTFLIILSNLNPSTQHVTSFIESVVMIFPCPIAIISIPLLLLQISAMAAWPKLKNERNITDKAMLIVGTVGMYILLLGELLTHIISWENTSSVEIVILFLFLTFHYFLQYVTISLAIDREWKGPTPKSWHSYICPTFGMLCINMAYLLITIYFFKHTFPLKAEGETFLKLFNKGLHSTGGTLIVITRLHSSIFFGKMTAFV